MQATAKVHHCLMKAPPTPAVVLEPGQGVKFSQPLASKRRATLGGAIGRRWLPLHWR